MTEGTTEARDQTSMDGRSRPEGRPGELSVQTASQSMVVAEAVNRQAEGPPARLPCLPTGGYRREQHLKTTLDTYWTDCQDHQTRKPPIDSRLHAERRVRRKEKLHERKIHHLVFVAASFVPPVGLGHVSGSFLIAETSRLAETFDLLEIHKRLCSVGILEVAQDSAAAVLF